MIKKLFSTTAAIVLLASASASYGNQVGAKISTLGIGLEYTFPVHEKFDVSIGYNQYDFSDTLEDTNITYDADLEWSSVSLLGNWRPYGGGFRITAGLLFNNNEIQVAAETTGNYTFADGTTFDLSNAAAAEGTLDFKSSTPYLGIGWSGNPTSQSNMAFMFDLGVAFQGTPMVELSGTCNATSTVTDCQALLDRVLAEEEADIKEDVDDFDAYPVFSLGVVYSF